MDYVSSQAKTVKRALTDSEDEYARLCEAQHVAADYGTHQKFLEAYEACKRAKVRLYYASAGPSTRPFHDNIPQHWIDQERAAGIAAWFLDQI